MLFLFNDRVLDLDAPEARLMQRWRSLGCGDPRELMAREALDFVRSVWRHHERERETLPGDLMLDLAALIVSKTGANAALMPTSLSGDGAGSELRLTVLPEPILGALAADRKKGGVVDAEGVWRAAA